MRRKAAESRTASPVQDAAEMAWVRLPRTGNELLLSDGLSRGKLFFHKGVSGKGLGGCPVPLPWQGLVRRGLIKQPDGPFPPRR